MQKKEMMLPIERPWKEALIIYGKRLGVVLAVAVVVVLFAFIYVLVGGRGVAIALAGLSVGILVGSVGTLVRRYSLLLRSVRRYRLSPPPEPDYHNLRPWMARDVARDRDIGGTGSSKAILACLAEMLWDADAGVRRTAAEALGEVAATGPLLAYLALMLWDADAGVRRTAAEALGEIGTPAATEAILARLAEMRVCDADAGVRRIAAQAVKQLRAR